MAYPYLSEPNIGRCNAGGARCASRAREVIPTSRLYPARVDKLGGSVLREHWSGIAGGAISSITSNANYPNKPGGREFGVGYTFWIFGVANVLGIVAAQILGKRPAEPLPDDLPL